MTGTPLVETKAPPVWLAAVLLAQVSLALLIGLPGQLSVDSITELYEGRSGHFISLHPPLTSVLLGILDRFTDAPAGFVVISTGLLAGATYLALARARAVRPWRLVLAGLVVLNPVLLIYSGIVWKDVLLAHAVALVYFLLASIDARGRPITIPIGIAIFVLLFTVAGARQQRALFAIPAGVWTAVLLRKSRTKFAMGLVAFAILPFLASRALETYVRSLPGEPALSSVGTGFRLLDRFDLAGILHYGGNLPEDTRPALANELRTEARKYTSYGIDSLTGPSALYWSLTNAEARSLWLRTIDRNFEAYLRHRGAYFLALLGFADMRKCLPVYSGVAGPLVHPAVGRDLDAILGLTPGPRHSSNLVNGFGRRMANTPLFMHAVAAVIMLAMSFWLMRRREYILLTLAACSLLFLGSYFIVGIACDFRYAYTLTVATTLLIAYVIVRPSRNDDARHRTKITAQRKR